MRARNGAEGTKAPGWAAVYRPMSEQKNKKGTATVLRVNRIQPRPANSAPRNRSGAARNKKSRCHRCGGGAGITWIRFKLRELFLDRDRRGSFLLFHLLLRIANYLWGRVGVYFL